MTEEELRNDMLYHAAISVGKTMLEQGLITKEEYNAVDKVFLEKYHPYIGMLTSENA